MNLKTKTADNVIVVNLEGRFDVYISSDVEKEINSIIYSEEGKHLLLNMKDVEYMNSSAVRIIMSFHKLLRETNRILKFCNINDSIKIIFDVLELEEMFEIYESEEEAIASFKKST